MATREKMNEAASEKAGKQKASTSPTSMTSQQTQPSQPTPSPYASYASVPTAAPAHQDNVQSQTASKVAIPRLNRNSDDQPPTKAPAVVDKNRVTHACEPCRQRKTKCSGERPRCQHCEDFKLHCVYADGKRDRTRKQLGSLASRLEEYEQLLEELSLRAGDQDKAMIRKALDKEFPMEDGDESVSTSGKKSSGYREPAGEYKASARAGSTESLDCIEEDYNRDPAARATGYHGKNSEVTWIQELKRPNAQSSEGDEHHRDGHEDPLLGGQTSPTHDKDEPDPGFTPVNQASYHCDDLTLTPSGHVDPFEVPPQAIADMLFQSYMESVHPTFPIVGRNTFLSQYHAFQQSADQTKINPNWLAILNLIFAIGAKYSHLIQAEWCGDKMDHLVYFTRARILGFNSEAILGHAELQKVQIAGLMSFYLLALNQINRSWAISGIAVRHATTLGLNLRNESKNVSESSKEIRYRVWWSLCNLERILAVMTGRPTSFSETDCNAPAPLPLEEESFSGTNVSNPQDLVLLRSLSSQESGQVDGEVSTPSSTAYSAKLKMSPTDSVSPASQERKQIFAPCNALAFNHHTTLSNFTNEVLNSLYRSDAMSKSWADVQSTIAALNSKLEKWRAQLPNVFDFTKRQRDQQFVRQRMSLGFSYYSTSAIINRPCLCRIDRKIANQSGKSQDFNREAAMKCVHAPRDMLQMLPQEPNAVGLYTVAPWWCLVHFFVQGATILMLELSLRSHHMPNEAEEIFDSAKKAVDWLRSLSQEDEAAKRAWSLCNEMLHKVAPKVGRSLAESSNNHGLPDHWGPAVDHAQGMDGNSFTQEPVTSGTYLPYDGYSSFVPFDVPKFWYYDQFLADGQVSASSASGPYNNMFPTAPITDASQYDEHAGYFDGQNQQRWFPSDPNRYGCG